MSQVRTAIRTAVAEADGNTRAAHDFLAEWLSDSPFTRGRALFVEFMPEADRPPTLAREFDRVLAETGDVRRAAGVLAELWDLREFPDRARHVRAEAAERATRAFLRALITEARAWRREHRR